MPKYKVYAQYTTSVCIGEVEAENEDDALDAVDMEGLIDCAPSGTLCHHCAREYGDLTQGEDYWIEKA